MVKINHHLMVSVIISEIVADLNIHSWSINSCAEENTHIVQVVQILWFFKMKYTTISSKKTQFNYYLKHVLRIFNWHDIIGSKFSKLFIKFEMFAFSTEHCLSDCAYIRGYNSLFSWFYNNFYLHHILGDSNERFKERIWKQWQRTIKRPWFDWFHEVDNTITATV